MKPEFKTIVKNYCDEFEFAINLALNDGFILINSGVVYNQTRDEMIFWAYMLKQEDTGYTLLKKE